MSLFNHSSTKRNGEAKPKPPVEPMIKHHYEFVRYDNEIKKTLPCDYVDNLREAFKRQKKICDNKDHPDYPEHPAELEELEMMIWCRSECKKGPTP